MREHHARAIAGALERLKATQDALLILLDGSLVRGDAREDSDVDLIVIVTDEGFHERLDRDEVAFLWTDFPEWPGGCVEGRFVSRSFVLAAAEQGSEPTRYAFQQVRVIWGSDPDIEAVIPTICVYPERDHDRRMDAFYTQMWVAWYYYWDEAVRQDCAFLKSMAATRIVQFAARLILAHERLLFPGQKRLMEILRTCETKPADFDGFAARTLSGDSEAALGLCRAVTAVVGERSINMASRFQMDMEMSWYTGKHDVAEW